MDKIEVSVIMPVYNAEKYLSESINSVLNQTFTNWELLVIDDCSKDRSSAIIHDYVERDSRIKYFKTFAPSGSPTLPRNIGIEKASGRFIAFLDSDDIWLPSKLSNQISVFDNNQIAIAYTDYEKISEDGKRNHRVIKAPMCVGYSQLLLGNVIGCLTCVYDTQKVGKVYFTNHSHEDYIMWLSILKKGYWAQNTQTIEALYRVREKSVSSNKLKAMSWQWDIYMQVEKLSILKASYCFINYAFRALNKMIK